ncbi:DNA damage-induced cell division inhibitor SosA [Staphylococcus ratti]
MIKAKLNEIYLYVSVFIISIIIFFVFFIMASHDAHTEQTYEMTDHQINTNQTEHMQKYEQKAKEQQSVLAFSVR